MFPQLAGISSFIFQLPLQLLFLECHLLEKETLAQARGRVAHVDEECPREEKTTGPSVVEESFSSNEESDISGPEEAPLFLWVQFAQRKDIWRGILVKVVTNPVIWGIVMGFFLSLTKIGPKYLKPGSSDYVPGLCWFFAASGWFGEM